MLRLATRLLLVHACAALHLTAAPPSVRPAIARAAPPAMLDIDGNTIAAVGALVVGLGGGIGLIAFTEGAGKRNEARESAQPCVECKGAKVVTCTICQGTGGAPR